MLVKKRKSKALPRLVPGPVLSGHGSWWRLAGVAPPAEAPFHHHPRSSSLLGTKPALPSLHTKSLKMRLTPCLHLPALLPASGPGHRCPRPITLVQVLGLHHLHQGKHPPLSTRKCGFPSLIRPRRCTHILNTQHHAEMVVDPGPLGPEKCGCPFVPCPYFGHNSDSRQGPK